MAQLIETHEFKCVSCGVDHSRFRDRAHTKGQAYCRDCHNAHMRRTRPKYSELTAEQKRRLNCRAYANVYQARGLLIPRPCECCGAPAEKHHDDYSKPLEVRWLCRTCHIDHHANGKS